MANPSLQIGNSNWAIKEDDLLGYSTVGTNYLPKPITITRASAGTRVNSAGLVETVELLGGELVDNGDFATDSDWVKQDGWTISGGQAHFSFTGTGNRNLYQSPTTSGKLYKLTFEITSLTQGRIRNVSTSVSDDTFFDTVGVHTQYYTSTGATLYLKATPDAILSIDNVSVKEVTKNDLARIDYTDGTSSLLVETGRTNVIEYSEDFSSSYWAKTNTDVISNAAVSPDGTQNADKLNFTTSSGEIVKGMAFVSGQTYTMSFYAKTESGTLDFNYGNMDYYVISGTATDEWQRFEITQTLPTTTRFPKIQTTEIGSLLLWGWQVEQGSYATSYIPTDGGTVTRVKDQYSKTGISDLIGQTEGTFFIELSKPVLVPDSYYLISLNNAASNSDDNSVAIGFENSNDFFIRVQANGTDVFYENQLDALNVNTFYKIAVSYKSGQSLIYIDGSPITPNGGSLSGTFVFTTTLDNLSFDFNGNTHLPFYGKVKQLQVFKTALTDSELKTLTT